jgi:D-tyrosyl-tRNA(Tyr) deacylase
MIALLQRVSSARVEVDGAVIGQIGAGALLLVCAEPADTPAICEKLLQKVLKLRVFADDAGKMNRSLADVQGGLLIVSQFTLAADLAGGNRPSFTNAAPPDMARSLFDNFVAAARAAYPGTQTGNGLPLVQTGQFAADMKVHLVNDGPVTIPMRISA